MSRSINTLKVELKRVGLKGGIIRRLRYWNAAGGYMPDDGPLGFFFVGEDGKETYFGKTLDESMEMLEQWGKKRNKAA